MPTRNNESPKFHNRRFSSSDLTIFTTILDLFHLHPGRIEIKRIMKKSGMTRQSFYNHYHDVNQAINKNKQALLDDLLKDINLTIKDKVFGSPMDQNRKIFLTCFIFMSKRKDVFRRICKEPDSQYMVFNLMEAVYPTLNVVWLPAGSPPPIKGSELVNRYLIIATGIFCMWGQDGGCELKRMDRYLKKLLRLSSDASRYCKI